MAPEVVKKKYNEKCDLWSCGVVLYMLLSGVPPFKSRANEEILVKIERGKYSLEGGKWDIISTEGKALIRKLMEYKPEKRITAAEALNDPWIIKNCTTTMKHIDEKVKYCLDSIRLQPEKDELQKVVCLYFATDLGNLEEKEKLAELFNNIDTKCDGVLDVEEIGQVYGLVGEKAKDIVQKASMGMTIEFSEFLAATYKFKLKPLEEQQYEVFDLLAKVRKEIF